MTAAEAPRRSIFPGPSPGASPLPATPRLVPPAKSWERRRSIVTCSAGELRGLARRSIKKSRRLNTGMNRTTPPVDQYAVVVQLFRLAWNPQPNAPVLPFRILTRFRHSGPANSLITAWWHCWIIRTVCLLAIQKPLASRFCRT